MSTYWGVYENEDYLMHYGVKGMKWKDHKYVKKEMKPSGIVIRTDYLSDKITNKYENSK